MVQRKAPTKISSQAETKRSHVKLERQTSSQKHQDTRSRGGGGGGGGGGDLKKKMKLERSIRAADLDCLKSMKPKKQSPNYMKPTSSSDARKERLQVEPSPKNSNGPNPLKPKPPSCPPPGLKLSKSLSRQSSLKAIRPLVNRATCSSTLKDSNFPRALDLNPEGTSVMKVCPYTYCSLNGHRHEPLPPLRSFIKARRKLIKTQKSMKLKGLSSWRGKGLGKDKGEIDTGQKAVAPSAAEEIDDFFVGVYTDRSEDGEDQDQIKETCEVASVDDGLDKRSELPDEEVDVAMSSLEYVERDRRLDDAEDEEKSGFVSKESENEESTLDFNWEGRVDNPCSDNLTKSSECPDDRLDLMPPQIESSVKDIAYEVAEADIEKQQGVDQESAGGDEFVVDEVGAGFAQEVSHKVIEICDDMIRNGDNLEGNDAGSREGEELCRADVLSQESTENGEELVSEESEEFSEAAHPHLKLNHENIKEEENKNENEVDSTSLLSEQIQSQTETTSKCDDATKDATISSDIKSYSYTRRKITDEQDEIREFNPRAPRFLDLEPDPEAEKVDLRHQMMDERKNSEEYLIDYALRRAVTKLDPARKKKVALLVEAFETVMPYKKSLRHKTSGFIHARIMQACS
ncbi:uncharacterized protein A4U43_C07F16110 [Asparagus officinalis]|uniref:Calmodulin-binding domain-containing protein n=1 Tax=Asparagus officinalis TaxID=4686 RepID=A0A5P1ECJ1_ASPOF|nr:uncharacterized protein LOC109848748 [Asparagus officinalis]XP_020273985.1 uncharacterized protein LOC109848748 [Asparagus officinalis]ONK63524.1 uncharacterized protein A4U43_C07F16110 [Asparagus officinalis]